MNDNIKSVYVICYHSTFELLNFNCWAEFELFNSCYSEFSLQNKTIWLCIYFEVKFDKKNVNELNMMLITAANRYLKRSSMFDCTFFLWFFYLFLFHLNKIQNLIHNIIAWFISKRDLCFSWLMRYSWLKLLFSLLFYFVCYLLFLFLYLHDTFILLFFILIWVFAFI